MSVLIDTSLGELVVDLETEKAPQTSLNFLKLCKVKYYNHVLVHNVQQGFVLQTGDPSGTGKGGESIWGVIHGNSRRYFEPEIHPKLKHTGKGIVSMALVQEPQDKSNSGSGNPRLFAASQFIITLSESPLDYLDGRQAVFGQVAEGMDTLDRINAAMCDQQGRPYRNIRIRRIEILDDPFDDPKGLVVPDQSPLRTRSDLAAPSNRIEEDEEINDDKDLAPEEIEKKQRQETAASQALTLEIIGDLPHANIKPPENVLFVCKLNPVTRDEDLELIFSRFGKIKSCEIIRDKKTQESLGYAFIEFENKEQCEEAYFKMDNVLIDDRRIHVDFSQSVSKLHRDVMMGQRNRFEDYGVGFQKRQRYRDVSANKHGKQYEMVFEHKQSSRSEQRHERNNSSRKRNRSRNHSRNRSQERRRRSRSRSRSRSPHDRSRSDDGRNDRRR